MRSGNLGPGSGVARAMARALVLVLVLFPGAIALAQPPSPEVVRRVLRREQAALDACLPAAPGPVRIRIRVGVSDDGTVAAPAVEVLDAPGDRDAFGVCVYRVLARLRFPEGPGGFELEAVLERRSGHLLLPRSRPLPPTTS